jgi:hypothetical protein
MQPVTDTAAPGDTTAATVSLLPEEHGGPWLLDGVLPMQGRRLWLGGDRAPARDCRPACGLTDEGQEPLQLARRTFKFASCRAVLNGEDLAEGEHGVGIVATWHRFAPNVYQASRWEALSW